MNLVNKTPHPEMILSSALMAVKDAAIRTKRVLRQLNHARSLRRLSQTPKTGQVNKEENGPAISQQGGMA
jgi:hypothetical protein